MSSESRHIVVAINPNASFGKHPQAGSATVTALTNEGYQVTELTAENFELLQGKVTLALRATPDALVVVGGDGMVSLAVNQLAQTSIPLGIIPVGTGNDLARGLGIPLGSVEASISHLIQSLRTAPQRIDLGRITNSDGSKVRWFASIASAGFDALVNERANAMTWPKGPARYIRALLAELIAMKPRNYQLEVDGNISNHSAVLIAVANNSSMGGGMKVTPEASLTDGLLDVFVLATVSKLRLLWLFPRVFSGTHVTEPEVSIIQGKKVRIMALNITAYADGERVWGMPLDIDIVSDAVRIYR